MIKKLGLVLAILISPVSHADFYTALDAYQNKDYASAFQEFSRLAKLGDIRSQLNLGVMYLNGQGVEKDEAKAYAWSRIAAQNANDAEKVIKTFKLIDKQISKRKQAETEYENLNARYSTAALLEKLYPKIETKGDSNNTDVKPIKIVQPKYPRDAAIHAITGFVRLTFDLDPNGKPRNIRVLSALPEKVFEKNSLASIKRWKFEPVIDENGNPVWARDQRYTMQYRLAGLPPFNPEAVEKIKRNASKGDARSQFALAYISMMMDKEEQERINPNELLLKASVQGLSLAQYELGTNLLYGKACQKDKQKGFEWLSMAASNGLSDAIGLLASLSLDESDKASQQQVLAMFKDKDVEGLPTMSKVTLAKLLSMTPFDELADPKEAIKLVESLGSREYSDEITKQEILAAAYARLGDFDKAIDYQEEALDDAEDMGYYIEDIAAHLDLLKQNKTWF